MALAIAGCTDDDEDGDEDVDDQNESDANEDGGEDDGSSDGEEEETTPEIWGSVPEYATWVGADEATTALEGDGEALDVLYLDASRWDEFDDDDEESDDGEDDGIQEPTAAVPLAGLFAFALSYSFGTVGYPFAQGIQLGTLSDPEERPENPVAVADRGYLVGGAIVLQGDVDAEAIVDAATGFEHAEDRGEFELYGQRTAEGEPGDMAFAVSEDAVVLGIQSADEVDDVEEGAATLLPLVRDRVDVGRGEANRAVDEVAEFERLVRGTDPGLTLLGTFGEGAGAAEPEEEAAGDDAFSDFDEAFRQIDGLGGPKIGLFGSLDWDADEERLSTATTLGYEDPDGVPDRAEVEGILGAGASSREVTIEDEFVHVEANWEEQLGDGQFRVAPY